MLAALLFALSTLSAAAEPLPSWLHDRPPPLGPAGPGDPFVRAARWGNALAPVGVGTATLGVMVGMGLRGTGPEVWAPVVAGGGGLAIGGALARAVALEAAGRDLRRRGLYVDRDFLLAGHLMAGAGVALVGLDAGLALADAGSPGLLMGTGGALVLLSTVPYAVHTSRTRRAYGFLDTEARTVVVAPSIDLDRGTTGLMLTARW